MSREALGFLAVMVVVLLLMTGSAIATIINPPSAAPDPDWSWVGDDATCTLIPDQTARDACDADPSCVPCGWAPYLVGGSAIIDAEGGKSNDSSNGGVSFSGSVEIASGWPPISGTCTQPADTQCGSEPSGWFSFYDSTNDAEDTLYLRMRVDGDPRSGDGFDQFHWNFLLDVDEGGVTDGYKELWIDVFGGFSGGTSPDVVRVLYENNGSNDVTNDDGAGGTCGGNSAAGGTVINQFYACSAAGLVACGPGAEEWSHTRVVSANDGTGEYFVDIQVPISALTDGLGCYSKPDKFTDTEDFSPGVQIVDDPTDFAVLYSTSNSNTDPLQKDYVDSDFGDVVTTPVTLASFDAERASDGAVVFRWTTATELGTAGFLLQQLTPDGWQAVGDGFVPTHQLDAVTPQRYEFRVGDVFSTRFRLVDVGIDGRARIHGPFSLGEPAGHEVPIIPIDWPRIHREIDGIAKARDVRAVSSARQRVTEVVDRDSRIRGKPPGGVFGRTLVCDLVVDRTGLYRVTFEDLAAAGFDLSRVDRRRIALLQGAEAVPIRVVTTGGTRLGPGSFVEFYGEAADTLYTRDNVYRLALLARDAERVREVTDAPGAGAVAPDAYQADVDVDDNVDYSFYSPTGDPWYRDRLLAFAQKPASVAMPLEVDHLAAGPATLHVGLWGVVSWPSDPDHHARVLLNGVELADERFDGLVDHPLVLPIPDGLLQEGMNTVQVVVPGDTGEAFDMVNLDRYGVVYPRMFRAEEGRLSFTGSAEVFEVDGLPTDDVVVYRMTSSGVEHLVSPELQPSAEGWTARVPGAPGGQTARYVVSTVPALLRPGIRPTRAPGNILRGRADYLVISHPAFLDGLDELVRARETDGWNVKVVDVEDLYSFFSGGVFDPAAIRDYIALAAKRLGTKMVLLVGGDTYDYLDYLGLGSISFIPSLYTDLGNDATFTPSDPLYGDVDGDRVPDVAVGRLPVRSRAELEAVLAKTLEFPSAPHVDSAVYAADGRDGDLKFFNHAEALVEELPELWQVTRAYIDELGADEARRVLIDTLDSGVALATFVGHSGPTAWTSDDLFTASDVEDLTNSGRPTVVNQWGCWNTYHVDPYYSTLSHELLLEPDRGAAVVMGAATITSVTSDGTIAPLLQELAVEPGTPIGMAMLEAKRRLAVARPGWDEAILGFTLLGDPGLVLSP